MALGLREKLKKSFENVNYFSATSDVWSRSNKSFIAVSVHYYENNSMEKIRSDFIACEHFKGHHTHDRVAQRLSEIFDRFGIRDRVYFITTDGAGEYRAAFTHFGKNYREIHMLDDSESDVDLFNRSSDNSANEVNEDNSSMDRNESLVDDEYESDDDPDTFIRSNSNDGNADAADAFRIIDVFTTEFSLGNMDRIDCSSHKLDKIGKIDSKNAIGKDEEYDKLHEGVFIKLESIWSLKDSRINAEVFLRITGRKVIGPHRIRWLKTCEAVCLIPFYINWIYLYTRAIRFCFRVNFTKNDKSSNVLLFFLFSN